MAEMHGASKDRTNRGGPPAPARWTGRAFLLLLLAAALAIAGWAAFHLIRGDWHQVEPQAGPLPEGWTITAADREVSALLLDGETLYAGGMEGIVTIDVRTARVTGALEAGVPMVLVKSLVRDRAGRIWAAHQGGLTVFDGDRTITYTAEDGLPDHRVNAVLEDRDGCLWVGTFGGAAALDPKGWRVIGQDQGLLDDMVNLLYEDSHGNLWFAHYVLQGGGASYLAGEVIHHVTIASGLAHNAVTTIAEDLQGRLWIGSGALTRGGANYAVWDNGRWELTGGLSAEDGLMGEKVRLIYPDDYGRLWFCSEYDGIAILRSSDLELLATLTWREGLSHNEVKAILSDADGNLWLGAHRGVTRIPRAWLEALP